MVAKTLATYMRRREVVSNAKQCELKGEAEILGLIVNQLKGK